eukprot:1159090-Pelagomonas_calceolata.AAC.5
MATLLTWASWAFGVHARDHQPGCELEQDAKGTVESCGCVALSFLTASAPPPSVPLPVMPRKMCGRRGQAAGVNGSRGGAACCRRQEWCGNILQMAAKVRGQCPCFC